MFNLILNYGYHSSIRGDGDKCVINAEHKSEQRTFQPEEISSDDSG